MARPDASGRGQCRGYRSRKPHLRLVGRRHAVGLERADTFVFSQPIGADSVHNFDVSADTIDLIGYAGSGASPTSLLTSARRERQRADHARRRPDDHHRRRRASALTAANFVFDVTPTVTMPAPSRSATAHCCRSAGRSTMPARSPRSTARKRPRADPDRNHASGRRQPTFFGQPIQCDLRQRPTVTFTNVDNVISGAGQLGGGSLTLINGGTIIANGANALVIDTGANDVTNNGTVEATGSGGLTSSARSPTAG